VQLQAWHYFTKQLMEYNFQGTFKEWESAPPRSKPSTLYLSTFRERYLHFTKRSDARKSENRSNLGGFFVKGPGSFNPSLRCRLALCRTSS
jgi:hypothetical protein